MKSATKWTVLAYLNGNSELKPETAAAKSDIERAAAGGDVEVLLQIGLLDKSTVSILRPDVPDDADGTWSGVRRYRINSSGSLLAGNLGNQNMADPKSLYNFITWGMRNSEAEHFMLILGGHSCEYIGMMNDYSQDRPYIMGIPEIALVLEYAVKAAGKAVDILVLDTCYFNNLEVLYELGQGGTSAVRTVLTYRRKAPADGLPYGRLLEAMSDYPAADDCQLLVKGLIEKLPEDLIAYEVNPEGLEHVKKLLSVFAGEYPDMAPGTVPDLPELFSETSRDMHFAALDEAAAAINAMIIGKKTDFTHPWENIRVLDKYIPHKSTAALYYRLAFARDNGWTRLLCSRLHEGGFRLAVSIGFFPLTLSGGKVRALIASSNPMMSRETAAGIFGEIAARWETKAHGQATPDVR